MVLRKKNGNAKLCNNTVWEIGGWERVEGGGKEKKIRFIWDVPSPGEIWAKSGETGLRWALWGWSRYTFSLQKLKVFERVNTKKRWVMVFFFRFLIAVRFFSFLSRMK